jgi:hypothetical protein
MGSDGTYVQRRPTKEKHLTGSQQILIERAEKRLRSATRLRRRKPKGFARRTFTT